MARSRQVRSAAGSLYLFTGCREESAAVIRLSPAGTVDPTYGDGGRLRIEGLDAGPATFARGLATQPNGELLALVGDFGDVGVPGWSGVVRLHNEPYGGTP